LPDEQRLEIGQSREERGRREEIGRVVPAEDAAGRGEFGALGGGATVSQLIALIAKNESSKT
jgi:hypothetical protein